MPIIIIVVALVITAIGLLMPKMGEVAEAWQTDNQSFRLQAEMRHERFCPVLCGAYYTFQYAPAGSDDWRELFTVHHDDPNPIPHENMRYVDSQIGYVFFKHKYAVTTDAGKSWTMWDAVEADKKLTFDNYKLYPSIVDVRVEADGSGRMRLYSITDQPAKQPELQTTNYGETWSFN